MRFYDVSMIYVIYQRVFMTTKKLDVNGNGTRKTLD